MLRIARSFSVFLLAASLVVLAGCGKGKGKGGGELKGKVVLPANVKLGTSDSVEVRFLPEGGDPKGGAAAQASGGSPTFEVKSIAAGKYKVAVSLTPYPGSPDAAKMKGVIEALNRKFDATATPLRFEVTADPGQTVTVDLVKGAVTK